MCIKKYQTDEERKEANRQYQRAYYLRNRQKCIDRQKEVAKRLRDEAPQVLVERRKKYSNKKKQLTTKEL